MIQVKGLNMITQARFCMLIHIGQKMPIFFYSFFSHETDLARLLKLESALHVLLSLGNLTKEDIMHFMLQRKGYHR